MKNTTKKPSSLYKKTRILACVVTASSFVTACQQNSNCCNVTDTPQTVAGNQLIAVGATADYAAASHALIQADAPYTGQTELNPSAQTDVTLSAYGSHFYTIGRFGANTITQYASQAPTQAIWQCSTEGDDQNSNPYKLIQVADNKAYVLRYGAAKIWIVNPAITSSTQCATDFKIGEIDLSSFDSDTIPEMSDAVWVNNKLYVTLQNLTFFTPEKPGQVAVIDTQTDTLVDMNTQEAGTQAIQLLGYNPQKIQYNATLNQLFVQSVGQYAAWDGSSPALYNGGIDSINLTNHQVQQVVDDVEATTHQITDMAIVNDQQAYFVGSTGFQNNTLFQFNPSTGQINTDTNSQLTAIGGIQNENIAGIKVGPKQTLWLATTSGFKVLNTQTNQVLESLIDTKMNPSGFEFIE